MSKAEWLAQTAHDPLHYLRWTSLTGSVMLSAGLVWDAVKVPSLIGLPVADPDRMTSVEGPSHHDPVGGNVYFLVPTGTCDTWTLDSTECLGVATYLCTPTPGIRDGRRPYWLQEPEAPAFPLVDPAELREALVAAGAEAVV